MAEATGNPFRDGRANLRETAKWMVSGALAAATLIIGSSTFSQLGSLDTGEFRFWLAIATLVLAAGLCWIPLRNAVDVLRSELHSLKAFESAKDGDLKDAFDQVVELMGTLPEGVSLDGFVRGFDARRAQAETSDLDPATRERRVADLDAKFAQAREICISQLVTIRFDRLMASLRWPGAAILVLFLAFTWAANPAKDVVKVFDRPYVEALSTDRIATLDALEVATACTGPGAQLISVGAPEAGPQIAVLTPPVPNPSKCRPRKVTLSAGRIVKVD